MIVHCWGVNNEHTDVHNFYLYRKKWFIICFDRLYWQIFSTSWLRILTMNASIYTTIHCIHLHAYEIQFSYVNVKYELLNSLVLLNCGWMHIGKYHHLQKQNLKDTKIILLLIKTRPLFWLLQLQLEAQMCS